MKLKKNGHEDNGITVKGLWFICSPSGILIRVHCWCYKVQKYCQLLRIATRGLTETTYQLEKSFTR